MEDKALLTEAYQLVSELNQTIQSCKQGMPDDLRLQQNISKNTERCFKSLEALLDLLSWYNQVSKSLWRKYEIKYPRNS